MEQDYIYLDSMVIRYLNNPPNNYKNTVTHFNRLLYKFSDKYVLPYSKAHLLDLTKGYSNEHKNKVMKNIQDLRRTTSCKLVTMKNDEYEIHVHDPENFFKVVLNDNGIDNVDLDKIKVDIIDNMLDIDICNIPLKHPWSSDLWKSGGVLSNELIENYFKNIFVNFFTDKTTYKQFVDFFKKSKEYILKNTSLPHEKSLFFFNSILPFYELFEIQNKSILKSQFPKIFQAFLNISKRNMNDLSCGDKIEMIYMLLDISPIFREKITKKNQLVNVTRDCKHLYYAHKAKFFITEDSNTISKSLFAMDYLGYNVKVLRMSELVNRFS